MKQYFNNGFAPDKSSFVDVDSNVGQVNSLVFTNKSTNVVTSVGQTKMVSGHISLTVPFKVSCSEECQDITLNESLRVQWNMRYDSTEALSALRAEVNRVLDEAIASYGLQKGLVPPVFATFSDA